MGQVPMMMMLPPQQHFMMYPQQPQFGWQPQPAMAPPIQGFPAGGAAFYRPQLQAQQPQYQRMAAPMAVPGNSFDADDELDDSDVEDDSEYDETATGFT